MRNQRHYDFGAGPGMVSDIFDGLSGAVAGAGLRQDQGEIRRPELDAAKPGKSKEAIASAFEAALLPQKGDSLELHAIQD